MANTIHKKTVIEKIKGVFKKAPMEIQIKGQPLYINPPMNSSQRLLRAVARFNLCQEKVASFKVDDPKSASWYEEMLRRKQEIKNLGGNV